MLLNVSTVDSSKLSLDLNLNYRNPVTGNGAAADGAGQRLHQQPSHHIRLPAPGRQNRLAASHQQRMNPSSSPIHPVHPIHQPTHQKKYENKTKQYNNDNDNKLA